MKAFILTCINESNEIISVNGFSTLEKAQNAMLVDYQSKLDNLLDDYDEDDFEEQTIGDKRASIVIFDNECSYWWDINEIDID